MTFIGGSVANVRLECESSACSFTKVYHFQPTAKLLEVDVSAVGYGSEFMEIYYGGSGQSETIVHCTIKKFTRIKSNDPCDSLIVDDSFGYDPSGGGSFTLDCGYLDFFDPLYYTRQSCDIQAKMERTRDVQILFFEGFWASSSFSALDVPRIQISGAETVKVVNPSNTRMEIEAVYVNISLSHGFNDFKIHPTVLKQVFVEGDFYGDTYEFMSRDVATEKNGGAQMIFTSDVDEEDAGKYWTFGDRWPGKPQVEFSGLMCAFFSLFICLLPVFIEQTRKKKKTGRSSIGKESVSRLSPTEFDACRCALNVV